MSTPESTEEWRPRAHYTPAVHFMNDPNGLVYADGLYHLFHQYNPQGNRWGHMSWKHATSPDLVHWTHLPVAIPEQDGVMAFSGSAVDDPDDTSGFGKDGVAPLVAVYTGHRTHDPQQSQWIAVSTDRGQTWRPAAHNPVLDWEDDFRDPKVFWHAETGRWIMVVAKAAQKRVRLYASPNLRDWDFLSTFGPEGADTESIPNWECPDLFPLPVEGRPGETRWVLSISVGGGHPAGGSGSQYFVGRFDGTRFVNDHSPETVLWADHGKDNYAAVTWSGVVGPEGERIGVGWMSDWQYAQDVPTHPWRNGLTVPRLWSLRETADGLRLVQRPVPALETLRQGLQDLGTLSLAPDRVRPLHAATGLAYELALSIDPGTARECGVGIRVGDDEETRVGFDAESGTLFVDRTRAGHSCSEHFPGRHAVAVDARSGPIRLRLIVDTTSVEVFADDGRHVLTDLIFPSPRSQGLVAYAHGGGATFHDIRLWRWDDARPVHRDAPRPCHEGLSGEG